MKLLWAALCECHLMLLTFGVLPAVLALWWEVAFIHGLFFPIPKVFSFLRAAGHALDCGLQWRKWWYLDHHVASAAAALGSESMTVSAKEKERKILRNNNQPWRQQQLC